MRAIYRASAEREAAWGFSLAATSGFEARVERGAVGVRGKTNLFVLELAHSKDEAFDLRGATSATCP